ncbi:MAG: hypothetical protein K8S23_15825 [Candidatus Cloacimonetes bacterium]|nr:hypothetical protein [Candidatus Cloacimonadota bacterium]
MKTFLKKLFWLGFFSAAIYYGYKFYQKVLAVIGINKTLPQYMENIIGERPKINLSLNLTNCTMKLLFSQETLDKNSTLEDMIQEYIDDFYPFFANGKLKIDVSVKPEVVDEEPEEEIEIEKETKIEEEEIVVDEKEEKDDTDFED